MNNTIKKLAASLCLTGALLFSATSCGVLEMRDASSEITYDELTDMPVLEQAERHNYVEKAEDAAATEKATEASENPAATEKHIRLAVSGGIDIDSRITADAASRASGEKAYSYLIMYAAVYPFIHNADVALTTLEVPCADPDTYSVTSAETPNMPAESLTALIDLGFDVINTAGTEFGICGDAGIRDTVENVCNGEVLQIGAYHDEMDAGDVRIYEKDGVKIAFLSVVEEAPESELVIPHLGDPEAVKAAVSYADSQADIVVVSVTWNKADGVNRIEPAKAIAEAGADLIIGNNGSTLETAEWIENDDGTETLLVYSLGNLITSAKDASTAVSGILTMDIVSDSEGIGMENIKILPVMTHYTEQNEYQVVDVNTYSDDMASVHDIDGLTAESLKKIAASKIPAAFISEE
ncbi:MAG: hypothetical protein E7658_00980 [Ruminococcaceae bacterium]|nr:hypothetical protein [Oscillospiraceae bacterium]